MELDKSIEHQAALTELKDTIKKVKEIEFVTTKIEKQLKLIEKKLAKEIEDNNSKFNAATSPQMLNDTMKKAYETATIELDKLNDFLVQEYNMYYTIYNDCLDLENDLKTITPESLTLSIKEAKKVLKNIKESSNLEYELEQKIVEKVYYTVYQVLKLESVYLESADLLNTIKQSDTDISYLKKYIEVDINKLDLTDPENEEIMNRILEIKKKGLSNTNYLDKELIKLLALSCDDFIIEKTKESLLKECTELSIRYNEIQDLITSKNNISNDYNRIKACKKKYTGKRLRNGIFLVGNFATVSIAAFGLFQGTKTWTSDKTYQTKIETFDSTESEVKKEESYLEDTPNSTIITEYTPWIEPGYFRENYTREIYTYDITKLELEEQDIRNFLTKELMEYEDILMTSTTETTKEKPDNLYPENIYQIKRVTQNKDKVHLEPNSIAFKNIISLELFLIAMIEVFILGLIKHTGSKNKQKRQHLKEELEAAERELLSHKERLNNLISQYDYLKTNLQQKYEDLPSTIRENISIRNHVKSLKKLPQSDLDEDN